MAQDIYQYGIVGVALLFLIEKLFQGGKYFVSLFFKTYNPPDKKNFGIYGNNTEAEIGKLITRVTLTESQMLEMRTNHLAHQEDIVNKMKKFEKALYKIGLKLKIEDLFE